MADGPLLLVRSAPRLRRGSVMPDIKSPAKRSSYQKYGVFGRDFSQSGTLEVQLYKKRQSASNYQYGSLPHLAPAKPLTNGERFLLCFRPIAAPMRSSSFTKTVAVCVLLALSACATAPSHINNVCAVFDQNDGWFDNWQSAAQRTQQKYGIPVPVLMATVRKESGFKSNAKPPRTRLLGFIPWKHVSSATGFSQALDGTWSQYQRETGNWAARRTKFADAVDFVGWYHSKTADTYGVARNDTYNLYLAYYLGWTAYGRGNRGDAGIQSYARATEKMAHDYGEQLSQCGN
jgi:hypothetical protein